MTDQEQQVVLLEHRSDIATLTMTYEPYNLVGSTLLGPLLDMIEQRYRTGRGRW